MGLMALHKSAKFVKIN